MVCPIQGMESVVATVSGYHGSERFNLIKLISQAGASYVGALSRSTTHLVCWRFEGKKYDFAKKFNTTIVNHRWVEECIKQGKRVPEHPYILESGEEVGPLLLEIPLVNVGLSTKNRKMLTDKLNFCDDSEKHTDLECGVAAWTESCLMNKSLFPDSKKGNDASHKSKHKLVKKASMKENWSSSRYCLEEPPLSGLLMQHGESTSHSSKHPEKDKRKIFSGNGESSAHSSKHPGSEASKDSNLCVKHPSTVMEMTSGDGCINVEDLEEIKNETQIEHVTRLPTSTELSCVICWTDFSSTRGVLPCGHRFCFSCIQNWADHMASRRKISTCPLCKASFVSITKVEDAATTDQKIYSQTIPCAPSDLDIFILTDQETHTFGAQSLLAPTCSACRCQEPEDLLISCHLCQIRRIHSYCLDPPLLPWTCMHCKDLQMLYHHTC